MSDELYSRNDDGSQTTISIRNKLDVTTAPVLYDLVQQVVADVEDKKVDVVVVDLSGLDLIDSSGVAAIVGLYKQARKHGGEVKIQGARDQPLAIFKLLRMDKVWGL